MERAYAAFQPARSRDCYRVFFTLACLAASSAASTAPPPAKTALSNLIESPGSVGLFSPPSAPASPSQSQCGVSSQFVVRLRPSQPWHAKSGGQGGSASLAFISLCNGTYLVYVSINITGLPDITSLEIRKGQPSQPSGALLLQLSPSCFSLDSLRTSGVFIGKFPVSALSLSPLLSTPPYNDTAYPFYLVANTAALPQGAVRGQLLALGRSSSSLSVSTGDIYAQLSGAAVIPAGVGNPDGFAYAKIVMIDHGNSSVSFTFNVGLDNLSNAYPPELRQGPVGVNGPTVVFFARGSVVVSFRGQPDGITYGSTLIDSSLAGAILARPENFYISLGSVLSPSGALRGQLSMPGRGNQSSLHRLPKWPSVVPPPAPSSGTRLFSMANNLAYFCFLCCTLYWGLLSST